MSRLWFFTGTTIYIVLLFVVTPHFFGVPMTEIFQNDASDYSHGAINLLVHGMYSVDGVHPFLRREPGMSVFLAGIYSLFGAEKAVVLFAVQSLVFFLCALYFCTELSTRYNRRVAGISFILLLISGSILHAIFSAYRECLALSILMLFAGVVLSQWRKPAMLKLLVASVLFAALVLTYYTFLFFLPVLFVVWWLEKRPLKDAAIVVVLGAALISLWAYRNYSIDGHFRVIDSSRQGVMWYVRGEQAEKVTGLLPARCLYAEYISRNWDGLPDACSFNALTHTRWPISLNLYDDFDQAAASGQAKILAHVGSYLWFSVFEVVELHIPFVGGGWSRIFNLYAALTSLLMYLGCALCLPKLFRREHAVWLLFIVYNTAVFTLTDATPRYLVPVLFAYAALAGIGYDAALRRLHSRSRP